MPTYASRSLWTSVASGYTGPGDVVSGAYGWWGLRAYSNAVIGNNAVKLRRDSDDATQNFATIAGGGLDLTAIASFKSAANLFIDTLYDQTGNGHHVVQAIPADQPAFILNGIGSLPVMTVSQLIEFLAVTPVVLTVPYSLSVVFNTTSASFSVFAGFEDNTCSAGVNFGAANNVYGSFTNTETEAAFNGIFHAVQEVVDGASSNICVDGTTHTHNLGSTNINSVFRLGTYNSSNFPFIGSVTEFGLWDSAFSGGNMTGLNTNQYAYWGIPTLDAATNAWVSAVVGNGGSVSYARALLVNALIVGLKNDGVWTKLDRLWLLAAENQNAAQVDLVANAVVTENGSPTFGADVGYSGFGAATYIDSNYDPNINAVNYSLNSASFSAWFTTRGTPANFPVPIGTFNIAGANIEHNAGTSVYYRANAAVTSTTGTLSTGLCLVSRTTSVDSALYANGTAAITESSYSSTALPSSGDFFIGIRGDAGIPNAATVWNGDILEAHIGGGFSSTEEGYFFSHLRTYMTAVGVP